MVYSERNSDFIRNKFKRKLRSRLSAIKEQARGDSQSQELTESFWVGRDNELSNKDEELNDGLKAIADRIKPGPGPHIPIEVWKLGCYDEQGKFTEVEFPSLDIATKNALFELSDPSCFNESIMRPIADYIRKNCSTDAIKQYLRDFHAVKPNSRCRLSRPMAIAKLTWYIVAEAGDCIQCHDLKHCADSIMQFTEDELECEAKTEGICIHGIDSKVGLVLRIVEYIHEGILVVHK
mmetsp:Transcript_8640/g.13033  ORF Transcript_8640/g.13033 Transcript_8640/m.13033 type:complete len:236 (-) Transcript_8640:38-745(-)